MFFYNSVESKVRLFTTKQDVVTLLHLRSFKQFQNFSEETWGRAAENMMELCFVASKMSLFSMTEDLASKENGVYYVV